MSTLHRETCIMADRKKDRTMCSTERKKRENKKNDTSQLLLPIRQVEKKNESHLAFVFFLCSKCVSQMLIRTKVSVCAGEKMKKASSYQFVIAFQYHFHTVKQKK
jgi:hypothetical protein